MSLIKNYKYWDGCNFFEPQFLLKEYLRFWPSAVMDIGRTTGEKPGMGVKLGQFSSSKLTIIITYLITFYD